MTNTQQEISRDGLVNHLRGAPPVFTSEKPYPGEPVVYDGQEYRVALRNNGANFKLYESFDQQMARYQKLRDMSEKDLVDYRGKLQSDMDGAELQKGKLSIAANKAIDIDDPDWIENASAQLAATQHMGKLQKQLNMRQGVIQQLLALANREIKDREVKAAQAKLQASIVDHKKDLQKAAKILQDHLDLAHEMGMKSDTVAHAHVVTIKLGKLLDII